MSDVKIFTLVSSFIKADFECMVIGKLSPLRATTVFLGESGILKGVVHTDCCRIQVDRRLTQSGALVYSSTKSGDLIICDNLRMRWNSGICGSRDSSYIHL